MATERAEALRPAPERGDTIAAGAVALTLLVLVVGSRFDDEWGTGIHLVYSAAAALAVIAMAAMSPRPARHSVDGAERPAGWQSVLFIAAFVLALDALSNLAEVLGVDSVLDSSGTLVWVGLLLSGLMLWFARGWNSGISNLLSALTLVVVILALVDWVFSPEEVDTFRWILLLTAVGFGAYGASQRASEPHHAVGDVNAAGVALLALAGTFLVEAILEAAFGGLSGVSSADTEVAWGWELVLLVGGALLIAYSVLARQAGPGYLGAANLLAFGVLASTPGEDGASLIGWPLVLIVVTGGLLALGLGRGNGRPGAGVPAGPTPEPSESPTAVQPQP